MEKHTVGKSTYRHKGGAKEIAEAEIKKKRSVSTGRNKYITQKNAPLPRESRMLSTFLKQVSKDSSFAE